MSLIFISHSSKDKAAAEELRNRLAEQGYRSVFLDFDPEDGIPAGRDWEQELYRGIRGCRAVIVLCSRHSMASRWCFMEITHARALGKPLLPVKIEPCDLDGVLADRQVIDLVSEPESAYQRLWRGLLASGLDPADAFDWDGSRPPYPGLLAFQEEDAAVFFGRDAAVAEGLDLLNKVRHFGQAGMVLVLGASGTGKSSLVRAGLLPRLRRDIERWLVVDPFRPRNDPARELAGVLSRAFDRAGRRLAWQSIHKQIVRALESEPAPVEPEEPVAQQVRDAAGAAFLRRLSDLEASVPNGVGPGVSRYLRLLRAAAQSPAADGRGQEAQTGPSRTHGNLLAEMASDLRIRGGRLDAKVLLVIDQFEELLGLEQEGASGSFLRFLRAGLEASGSPLLALATMRSDFMGALQRCPALLGQRYESLPLGPMSRAEVAQIIEKPAEVASIDLEPGLVQALLEDAETEDSLPLLAFTLRELNERFGDDRLLSIDEYRVRLGGLHGAVAKSADELLSLERIDEHRTEQLRRAFLDMARISEDGHFTRRPRSWDDFDEEIHPLLERFVKARLLVSGTSGGERTLEVAHEALFHSWDRLRTWLEENSEALRLRHEIQYGARTWQEAGRIEEDLWRGGRLARARELIDSGDLLLEDLDREFVEASHRLERAKVEAEEQRRKQELRRTRIFAGVLGAAFVFAAGLGIYALLKRADALENQARAESATAEAEENLDLARINEAEARKQEGIAIEKQHEAEEATRLADSQRLRAEAGEQEARAQEQTARKALSIANTEVALRLIEEGRNRQALAYLAAALRLDSGNTLAAGWTAELLRWGCGAIPLRELRFQSRAVSAEFSADGRRLHVLLEGSTLAPGATLALDAATGEGVADGAEPVLRSPHAGLSEDGRLSLTIEGGTVQVHDAASDRPVGSPMEHESKVASALFSRSGGWVVTTSDDGTARVWNAKTGQPASDPIRDHGPVASASLSRDGNRLATTSSGAPVRIWNISKGGQLEMELSAAGTVELSPDGLSLLTVSRGTGQAQVWNLASGTPIGKPQRSEGELTSGRFSPDARRVVTTWGHSVWLSEATRGGAEIHDAASGRPMGVRIRPGGSVISARFSPGGGQVVTTSSNGSAAIWEVSNGDPIAKPLEHEGPVRSAQFSSDGRQLLTLWGRQATLWDVANSNPKASLPAESARFVMDGASVATVLESGIQLWDSITGRVADKAVFEGAVVGAARFSSDGTRVAIQSNRGIRVHDTTTGEPIGAPLKGSSGETYLQFSPDGTWLLTAWTVPSGDGLGQAPQGRAQVWRTATGEHWGGKLNLPGQLNWAEFSPDGQRVVTAWGSLPLSVGFVQGGAQVWDVETGLAVGEPLHHDHAVHTAQFSPDGRRVVTAWGTPTRRALVTGEVESPGRGGAQIWDVETGAAIGRPFLHEDSVQSAWFSPDGRRVVTTSEDGTARIWDVSIPPPRESEPLAHLAEVVGGYVLSDLGRPVPMEARDERLRSLRERAASSPAEDAFVPLMTHWLFADQRARGISPLAQLTYEEYLERLFSLNGADS